MQIERAIYMNNVFEGLYILKKINDVYWWSLSRTLVNSQKDIEKYIRLDVEWRDGMSKANDLKYPFQFVGDFLYCEGDLGNY